MKTRYAFYLVVFAIFIVAAFSQYTRKFHAESYEIETLLRQVVVHINDLVKSSADAVDLMRLQAESRFRDPRTGRAPGPIRRDLVERPWGGYALPDPPKGRSPESVGNLTGLGSLVDAPLDLEREIDVALGLNPLFSGVAARRSERGMGLLHVEPESHQHRAVDIGRGISLYARVAGPRFLRARPTGAEFRPEPILDRCLYRRIRQGHDGNRRRARRRRQGRISRNGSPGPFAGRP